MPTGKPDLRYLSLQHRAQPLPAKACHNVRTVRRHRLYITDLEHTIREFIREAEQVITLVFVVLITLSVNMSRRKQAHPHLWPKYPSLLVPMLVRVVVLVLTLRLAYFLSGRYVKHTFDRPLPFQDPLVLVEAPWSALSVKRKG